jgi:hypothetical protein
MPGRDCQGCSGSSNVGGYLYARRPADLWRVVTSRSQLWQVELDFAPRVDLRAEEQALIRLANECGCNTGAVAFLIAVAVGVAASVTGWWAPPWYVFLACCVGVAIVAKVTAILVARIRITLLIVRLSHVQAHPLEGGQTFVRLPRP